jgi:hypothetical protein
MLKICQYVVKIENFLTYWTIVIYTYLVSKVY